MTRGLLLAAHGADLSVLRTVLEQQHVNTSASEDVGPGATLSDARLNAFDFAISVIPPTEDGLSAVLVETGIAVGRHLPILLIVPPEITPPAALAPLRVVRASLDNEAALALHVRLFIRSLAAAGIETPEPAARSPVLQPEAVGRFRDRLTELRTAPPRERGSKFERFVVDVLRDSGAVVEQDKRVTDDLGVDAVAIIPGEEHRLGALLIQAKSSSGQLNLARSEHQLQSYVLGRGGGLGILVYDALSTRGSENVTPLVLSLRADELLDELQSGALADIILRARNEAIHRL